MSAPPNAKAEITNWEIRFNVQGKEYARDPHEMLFLLEVWNTRLDMALAADLEEGPLKGKNLVTNVGARRIEWVRSIYSSLGAETKLNLQKRRSNWSHWTIQYLPSIPWPFEYQIIWIVSHWFIDNGESSKCIHLAEKMWKTPILLITRWQDEEANCWNFPLDREK